MKFNKAKQSTMKQYISACIFGWILSRCLFLLHVDNADLYVCVSKDNLKIIEYVTEDVNLKTSSAVFSVCF